MNYAKSSMVDGENKAARDPKSIKWHDLALDEYADAAAQVHSVVFAQLGTLSREFLLLVHIYYPDSGCISNYLFLDTLIYRLDD